MLRPWYLIRDREWEVGRAFAGRIRATAIRRSPLSRDRPVCGELLILEKSVIRQTQVKVGRIEAA
jgi:hypothetical protein